ncbi:hydroperoxide isomerase ALOXE3-like [Terrapene carolina triunguis]|uniref:hydroperoxide isomerase ALOXE3-like n=1 Tax=Terrapene triunguis TaxID=2587831 RepID=UPI000E778574|nr:hydroperoxide isomerase ALOXE3-like [Terrapene carolina triunguis]
MLGVFMEGLKIWCMGLGQQVGWRSGYAEVPEAAAKPVNLGLYLQANERQVVEEFKLCCGRWLGDIILVRLHKEPYSFYPTDNWYCSFVEVVSSQGQRYHFPCYQWVEGYRILELREGKGQMVCGDADSPLLLEQRQAELKHCHECYGWKEFAPGAPRCLNVDNIIELDCNSMYSFTKSTNVLLRGVNAQVELQLKGFLSCTNSWAKLADINKVFCFNKTPITGYVRAHWREDTFFGYQFLNRVHPVVIRRCTELPCNFPVTSAMVASSLGESTSLQDELEKGNIFLADYKILEGVPANTINGYQQYIAAPLCLLHLQPSGELVPVAIQLSQCPGPTSPIFLPSDSEWDWILAKTWVRNADFLMLKAVSHLLLTHLINEAFALATLRQLPIFKLLMPHTRYTLHINILARNLLLKREGIFDRGVSMGHKGVSTLIAKAMKCLTYDSLCIPDDVEARGVGSIANYFYRDDGLKIWSAIESFVSGITRHYYRSDAHILADCELQAWADEIFREGFLGNQASSFPSSLQSIPELIKYLTMWIYCCSARHAALNNGQYELGAWMPNFPATMRHPPPQAQGTTSLESYLDTIPEVNSTSLIVFTLWVICCKPGDSRSLGTYPDEHFTEEEPKRLIAAFQGRLAQISQEIQERNKSLPIPYRYLDPHHIKNSTSI